MRRQDRGKVSLFVDFGAFVDLGGFEALLHNNDLTWRKVYKKKKIIQLGEEREFVILSIKKDEKKYLSDSNSSIPTVV
jgi:ribosomal protein S1